MKLFDVDKDKEIGLKSLQFLEGLKSIFLKAAKEDEIPHLPWGEWNKRAAFEKEIEKLTKQVLRNQWKYAFRQGLRVGIQRFCSEGIAAIIGKTGGFRFGD